MRHGQATRRWRASTAVAALAVLGLSATALATEPLLDGAGGDATAPGALTAPVGALDPATEDAIKRGELVAGWPRVEVAVDLDALAAHPRFTALPAALAAQLGGAETDVPVLLPDTDTEALEGALVTLGDGWYEASLALDGGAVTLVVGGSVKAVAHPELTAELGDLAPLRTADGVLLSRTHGIVSASFLRFGEVAYTVDIECAAPLQDTRCTEDAFIHTVIDTLTLAAGPSR